jgi:ferredoxin
MIMRVSIDGERCTGHGRCYSLAPGMFDADDRGLGIVRGDGEVPAELEHQAQIAAANCPEQAVIITP